LPNAPTKYAEEGKGGVLLVKGKKKMKDVLTVRVAIYGPTMGVGHGSEKAGSNGLKGAEVAIVGEKPRAIFERVGVYQIYFPDGSPTHVGHYFAGMYLRCGPAKFIAVVGGMGLLFDADRTILVYTQSPTVWVALPTLIVNALRKQCILSTD